jgi:hypothetical protein
MLKRRILEPVLVAFSAAYLTAMVFVFLPSEQPCQDTNSQSYQDRAYKRGKDEQCESFRHWDATGFFTFWLVIVGGVQIVMFLAQLKSINAGLVEARKSANAAETAAGVAKDALVAAHRPWIKIVSAEIVSPLSPFGGGAMIGVRFRPKNIGKSPGRRIWINAILVEQNPSLLAMQTRFWQPEAAPQPGQTFVEFTMLPDDEFLRTELIDVAQDEIERIRRERQRPVFAGAIVGCVRYQFALSEDIHRTGFIYLLLTTAQNGNRAIDLDSPPTNPADYSLEFTLEGMGPAD